MHQNNKDSCTLRPDSNSDYANKDYWDRRYRYEEKYDWLGEFSDIQHLIQEWIPQKSDRILMLGCGNSQLSRQMFQHGYHNLVNVDISEVCIQNQIACHEDTPMTWLVADVTNLEEHFSPDSFDVVIEKATLDSLLVHEKSPWSISEAARGQIEACLSQVSRLLKTSGRFLSFTFSAPHFRTPMYAVPSYQWDVTHRTFGSSFLYHFYAMTKGRKASVSLPPISYLSIQQSADSNCSEDEDDDDFLLKICHDSDGENTGR